MIWIVGRGGLLGAALERAVRREPAAAGLGPVWGPPVAYAWGDEAATAVALERDAVAFRDAARVGDWCVAWCAGRGVIGSTDADMAAEWRLIESVLRGLGSTADGAPRGGAARGTVFFASSAGAVYGPGTGEVLDESSPVAPTTAYGRGKLEHEARLARWSVAHGVALRIARITTLVGPAQSLDKGQGLVSLMAGAARVRRPLNVYVPLSTARNYLHADDAGRIVARWLASGATEGGVRTKVVHAPRSASIATLVRGLHDVTRRRPPVTLSARRGAEAQAGLATYRSIVDTGADRIAPTPLPVTLRQVVDAAGRLPRRA